MEGSAAAESTHGSRMAVSSHLRIDTPPLAVAALPHLLGFQPEDSAVLMVMRGPRDRRLRVVMRMDLPDRVDDHAEWAEVVLARAVRAGAIRRPAYLLGVTEPQASPPEELLVTVRTELVRVGVLVEDPLLVRGDRYRVSGCSATGCCPPEGRGIPRRERDIVARHFPGPTPGPRRLLAAALAPRPVPPALAAALDRTPPPSPAVRDLAVAQAVSLLTDDPARYPDDLAARGLALASLVDVHVRDTVLWDLLHGPRATWARAADRLEGWVREAPDSHVAAPATILAVLRWQEGDGARGHVALDRALAADHRYRLAILLRACFDTGQPPGEWLRGLDALRREVCLGDAA